MFRYWLIAWCCCLLACPGCKQEAVETPVAAPKKLSASKLTVLVVEDPGLAAGIKLLRGEWAERTGGEVGIEQWTREELLSAKEVTADLVVYPSRYVGTLVDRGWLRPVRSSVLKSEDLDFSDILPVVRNHTLRFGDEVYGFSLGEPPLMLTGVAAEAGGRLPKTWGEADLQPGEMSWPLAVELLLRGVAYSQRDDASWFDSNSMEPKIATPPFVHALEEILANRRATGDDRMSRWEIALPSNAEAAEGEQRVFGPLPRAEQTYNSVRESWEPNDSGAPLCFLGVAGRTASVTRSTRNSASAFKLLQWMVGEGISSQLSPRSRGTLWFRKTQENKARKWLPEELVDDQAVGSLNAMLAADSCYLLPRIPGVDEYLSMMDAALAKTISEGGEPEEILQGVAEGWNAITERYGRDRQRAAYRRHLNLDDSNE